MKFKTIISALLNLFTIAKKTHKEDSSSNEEQEDDNQLVQLIPINDTPFTAAKQEGKWYLLIGKYRLSEGLPTLKDVKENAKRTDWFRVMEIMQVTIAAEREQQAELEKLEKRAKEQQVTKDKAMEHLKSFYDHITPNTK